jgi:hypothetical protein
MANVFEALEAEWRRLGRDRGAAARLAEVCRGAGQARTLHEVEAYVRRAGPAEADQVLLTLVARVVNGPPADDPGAGGRRSPPPASAPTRSVPPDGGVASARASAPARASILASDPARGPVPERELREVSLLAARVALQLLLPGTRKLARRWWALGDRDERAAAAVAAVYHHIRTYPLARRPGRVAANILMDAAYDLRRTVPRVITVPVEDPAALRRRGTAHEAPDPSSSEELAEVLTEAVAAGTIVPADAELIARSRIAGEAIDDIARERGRTARTMWHRRQHAEAALAAAFRPTC